MQEEPTKPFYFLVFVLCASPCFLGLGFWNEELGGCACPGWRCACARVRGVRVSRLEVCVCAGVRGYDQDVIRTSRPANGCSQVLSEMNLYGTYTKALTVENA